MNEQNHEFDQVGICPRCSCGKLSLPSRRIARRSIRGKFAASGKRMKMYRCPRSGELHLTTVRSWR